MSLRNCTDFYSLRGICLDACYATFPKIPFDADDGIIKGFVKLIKNDEARYPCIATCLEDANLERCISAAWMRSTSIGIGSALGGAFFAYKAVSSFYASHNKAALIYTTLSISCLASSYLMDTIYAQNCPWKDCRIV